VDFGLPSQWRGRVFVFDALEAGALETRLHLLATLAGHVTAPLSNLFLLRRLRSRAGAAERARVARELHDGTIQALLGIEMRADALRRRAEAEAPSVVHELSHLQQSLRDEVIGLRELMQELRPVDLDASQYLPEVLTQIVERFSRETGTLGRFVSHARTERMSVASAIEIVRIVQESLINVRKHSGARHVTVRLDEDQASGWRLTIEDDGCGFAFTGRLSHAELDARWLGPATIKDRVRAISGELWLESQPDQGARMEIRIHGPSAA
jgi:two-component system, NarL family, nitrate/nitrite sensor histidine kinase NarX